MQSKSVFKTVAIFIALSLFLTLIWNLVFAMTITPADAEMTVEPFPGASLLLGVMTAFLSIFIFQFNQARALEQKISSNKSSIETIKKRNLDLMNKANRLVDKHQMVEKQSYLDLAKASGGQKEEMKEVVEQHSLTGQKESQIHITTSQEFGKFMRDFPELSHNQNVQRLLDELINSENYLSDSKIILNQCVEAYNSLIHQFPLTLGRKVFKLEDASYYQDTLELTDEMLGLD